MASKEQSETPEPNIAPELSPDPFTIQGLRDRLGNLNGLPDYTEQDDTFESRLPELRAKVTADDFELPITRYPENIPWTGGPAQLDNPIKVRGDIVETFFDAIKTKKDEIVALLIENNFVTTETTDKRGRTPLLGAVEANNVRGVQELMDFGADVNAYGVVDRVSAYGRRKPPMEIRRTPLQLAAAKGHLNLVKLFMETYHANDASIAPDGELALRLASVNGHREIVDYLPSRRGGGWKRWKTKHSVATYRIKKASRKIYHFFKILLFEIPKFFVWSCPKHLVALPLYRGMKWTAKHYDQIPGMIATRIKDFGKWLWEVIRTVPEIAKGIVEGLWHVIKSIPKALKIAALWLWNGIKTVGSYVGSVFERAFSFLHTVVMAVVSFFRQLTPKNVWEGFCSLLRVIFVAGPVKLWHWIKKFGDVSWNVLDTLFGCIGWLIWYIGAGLLFCITYVPRKLFDILQSIGGSIAKAWTEVLIWMNPKR